MPYSNGEYYDSEEVVHVGSDVANRVRESLERQYDVDGFRLIVFHVTDRYALVRYPDGTFGGSWIRYFPGWVDVVFLEEGEVTSDRAAVWRDLEHGFLHYDDSKALTEEVDELIRGVDTEGFVNWCDQNDGSSVACFGTRLGLMVSGGGYVTRRIEASDHCCVYGEGKMLFARSRVQEDQDHAKSMADIKKTLNVRLRSWREEIRSCSTDDEINEVLMRFSREKSVLQ